MINKLRKLSYAIVVAGLLFAQYSTAMPADDHLPALFRSEYFVLMPLEPRLSSDGKTLYNAGLPVVYVADPNPSQEPVHIPAPIDLLNLPESASATFSITYVPDGDTDPWGETCYTFPDEAKAAFNGAANIWASILQSSVPITISACWANLGSSSTLGYSGGGPSHRNFTGAPLANTWYMGSLANALAGSDLAPSSSDMYITYNLNFPWYYGTDGKTPKGEYDLMSVVLHEIAHGLNFSGSMTYLVRLGSWGYTTGYPDIYDTFMRDGAGNQLINTGVYGNPSIALGNALTSDDIWFHGSNAMAANGGQRVKIYAPSTWSSGSSYAHLDYNTFNNTANQLMVYAISEGESIHDPGPVTKGLLKDLGWPNSQPGLIVASVKANNSDGPITVSQNDPLSITVSLNSGSHSGENADWWAVAVTPFGPYSYDVTSVSWNPGVTVTHMGPLFNLPSFEVLNRSGLPIGPYTFYFGVDMNMNGSLDMDQAYYDSVDVNIVQ